MSGFKYSILFILSYNFFFIGYSCTDINCQKKKIDMYLCYAPEIKSYHANLALQLDGN